MREKDLINNVQYDYTYDSTGRLVRKTAKDSTKAYNANSLWYNLEYGYDLNNNITRLVYRMPQRSILNKYSYDKDNLLKKYDINDSRSVSYGYDGLNRLTDTLLSTDRAIVTEYEYYQSKRGDAYTTTKLLSETIDGEKYTYEYDTLGNITGIQSSVRGSLYSYEYDAMNQLINVEDHKNSKLYMYSYDAGGNLTSEDICDVGSDGVQINTQHKSYEYGDSNWKDKLTKYNGQEITYDAIGNPLTYRDGMTMTWKNGRQLDTLTDGTNNVSYSYDSNSVRISKTVNGVKYTYAYINGMLMYETRGEAKFYYSYDANGTLYSVKYTLTDSSDLLTYYYTHNFRGDIVGIYNGAGQLRAHYEYDAWGNVLSVTDQNGNAITSSTHIGNLNPFRYRGYYYDTESGFYYLMSRYYDPVIHRFINCDGYFQAGGDVLDANMSAYCRNNPINSIDKFGNYVFAFSFCVDATAALGAYISINFVFDGYGNTAIQYSYIDYSENGYVGVIDASAGATVSFIWDAQTVYDMEKSTCNIGASGGYIFSAGLDLIELDELEKFGGVSLSAGVGIGVDIHEYTTTTKTIWSNNSNSNSQSSSQTKTSTKGASSKAKGKTQFRTCIICGCPHIPVK